MANSKRVGFESLISWELGGESVIHGEVQPDPPDSGKSTQIRLTHSNSYGPMDDVTFHVRVGDLQNPTGFQDLDGAADWKTMALVEEVVWLDGRERHRSEVAAELDPREETVWAGTFEAELALPKGDQRIEIKVMSTGHLPSGVISDWRVTVG